MNIISTQNFSIFYLWTLYTILCHHVQCILYKNLKLTFTNYSLYFLNKKAHSNIKFFLLICLHICDCITYLSYSTNYIFITNYLEKIQFKFNSI